MRIPRLTCEGCGYRTVNPFRYADHRFICEPYAAMRGELADLCDEFEDRGDDDDTVADYKRREAAIVNRYRQRWEATS